METGFIQGSQPTTFRAGMRVTASGGKFNGNGTVEKVNPRMIRVRMDEGRVVNFDRCFLRPEGTPAPEPLRPVVTEIPIAKPAPALGTVVRVPRDPRIAGYFVVVGETYRNGHVTVRIAKLGGGGGRYWRVPSNDLEVVHESEVLR